MKGKFCISKTVFYLIALFILIITGLYINSFLSTQKISNKSEASVTRMIQCSDHLYFDPPSTAPDRIKNYCLNLNNGKYSYGGGWGINATCYATTKTCLSSPNCQDEGCIRCLNQRVDPQRCVDTGAAPSNTLTRQIQCPTDGKVKYGWGGPGNTCYSLNGGIKFTQAGSPYCVNKVVDNSFCCNNNAQPSLFNPSVCCTTSSTDYRCQSAPAGTVKSGACTPNKITQVGLDKSSFITWCRYETGVKRTNGSCALGYSDNDAACAAGVGGRYRP